MKNLLCFACLCLLPLSVLAEDAPSALQSLDLTGDLSGPGCVAACEQTLTECKHQCDNSYASNPDASLSSCYGRCEQGTAMCKEDC